MLMKIVSLWITLLMIQMERRAEVIILAILQKKESLCSQVEKQKDFKTFLITQILRMLKIKIIEKSWIWLTGRTQSLVLISLKNNKQDQLTMRSTEILKLKRETILIKYFLKWRLKSMMRRIYYRFRLFEQVWQKM